MEFSKNQEGLRFLPTLRIFLATVTLFVAGPLLGLTIEKFNVYSGIRTSYKVVLPDHYDSTQEYPAILAFSGGGQTMDTVDEALENTWRAEAERRGSIVIMPATSDGQLFFSSGDRIFLLLMRQILQDYKIQGGRFHVAGSSNGGTSALHLAVLYPQYVRSVTAFPGFLIADDLAHADRLKGLPVHMLVGDQDTLMFDTVTQQAAQLIAQGLSVDLGIEKGQPHGLKSLIGPGAGRLFDWMETNP